METCIASWCVFYLVRKNCQVCLILFDLDWFVGERVWKPSIKYFDFFAQSTKQSQVKQVFPFVKVRLVSISHSHPLVCFSALALNWCASWLHKAHYRQRWWTWTLQSVQDSALDVEVGPGVEKGGHHDWVEHVLRQSWTQFVRRPCWKDERVRF